MLRTVILILALCFNTYCKSPASISKPEIQNSEQENIQAAPGLMLGAEQLDILLPLLQNKRVALLVNHTATIGDTHLVDTLLLRGVNIKKIFGPEHGFRGNAADGEVVKNGVDTKSGLPVVSLYGNNRKPTREQIADIDIVIFDIQDVGTRFYTYISSLHYLMETCAENGKQVIVLDRPNPHGGYVDGPILEPEFRSFVGMHRIPVVHGLTVGELAQMIIGEGWLGEGKKCDLKVIGMKNWNHGDEYLLPIAPSPNLPNNQAIRLYPSLCFFEGTAISVGRGTEMPFQVLGNPLLQGFPFSFTPATIPGVAVNPPHEGKLCYGLDLRKAEAEKRIDLSYLINMYNAYPDKDNFFTNPFDKNYIDKLAGTAKFKQQVRSGMSEDQIRETWKKDLETYQEMRRKYLLYP
jgi:uncharacterized protein YbbC (DUF1343 family)